MSKMNIPGFSADASFYRGSAYYQVGAMLIGLRQVGEVLVHPAARPIFYRSMKGFCIDLRDIGIPRICCNGDECGTDVLI